MRCISTFCFTAVALVIGMTVASAASSGIANATAAVPDLAQFTGQKAMMSKAVAAEKVHAGNALRDQASALAAPIGGAGMAMAEQRIGPSSALALQAVSPLQAGSTSGIEALFAPHQALAPTSQLHGMVQESSALAAQAKAFESPGTAARFVSPQSK